MGKLGLICLSRNKNLSVSFQEREKSRDKHIYFDISLWGLMQLETNRASCGEGDPTATSPRRATWGGGFSVAGGTGCGWL